MPPPSQTWSSSAERRGRSRDHHRDSSDNYEYPNLPELGEGCFLTELDRREGVKVWRGSGAEFRFIFFQIRIGDGGVCHSRPVTWFN